MNYSTSLIQIKNKMGEATISKYGGQLISWKPLEAKETVIWLSDKAQFSEGKAIRGGIPICWPWFGNKEGYSAHGLVRTKIWKHVLTEDQGDVTLVKLQCSSDGRTLTIWPFSFLLEIEFHIADELLIALKTYNTGKKPFYITEALHTYFHVSHIKDVIVQGFEGVEYLDKTKDFISLKQHGKIRILEETDRIYLNPGPATIIDNGWKRNIHIRNSGNVHTVLWNPGIEKSQAMADMSPWGYTSMLCVESANTKDLEVAPGEKHTLTQEISVV